MLRDLELNTSDSQTLKDQTTLLMVHKYCTSSGQTFLWPQKTRDLFLTEYLMQNRLLQYVVETGSTYTVDNNSPKTGSTFLNLVFMVPCIM